MNLYAGRRVYKIRQYFLINNFPNCSHIKFYLLTHTGVGVSHWPRTHVEYLLPTRVNPSLQLNLTILPPRPRMRILPLVSRIMGHDRTERQ